MKFPVTRPPFKCSTKPVCRSEINNIKGSLSDSNERIPKGLRAEIRQLQLSEPWWEKIYTEGQRYGTGTLGMLEDGKEHKALPTRARPLKAEQLPSDSTEQQVQLSVLHYSTLDNKVQNKCYSICNLITLYESITDTSKWHCQNYMLHFPLYFVRSSPFVFFSSRLHIRSLTWRPTECETSRTIKVMPSYWALVSNHCW